MSLTLLDAIPQSVRRRAQRGQAKAGATIFCKGDRPTHAYFVTSGELRLLRRTADGLEVVLQRCRSGLLAESSILHDHYHCDGVAHCDSEYLLFPLADFRNALSDPDFQTHWQRHVLAELRHARSRAERFALTSVRERLIHFIEMNGQDGCHLIDGTLKDIAVEIGVTQEAFYRALSRMKSAGELVVDGRTLRLAPAKTVGNC